MSEACWRHTRVSGPGQNFSTRVRAHGGHALGERVERGGGGDQHRRRHLAAPALGLAAGVRTASWEKASAAMP